MNRNKIILDNKYKMTEIKLHTLRISTMYLFYT